jgi:hypothetical protein
MQARATSVNIVYMAKKVKTLPASCMNIAAWLPWRMFGKGMRLCGSAG